MEVEAENTDHKKNVFRGLINFTSYTGLNNGTIILSPGDEK
jgi:hypothetical protein